MEKLAHRRCWCPEILVPCLKGLGEPVTQVFIVKMLNFFLAFSLGPSRAAPGDPHVYPNGVPALPEKGNSNDDDDSE